MGVSTDGQLCFGISIEEDTELPWDCKKYEGDIEVWWRDINGFNPNAPSPFSESGNWRPEFSETERESMFALWYKERKEWDDRHPIPVEVVLHCSYDYPMYIIAAKGKVYSARRGYPERIDTSKLTVTQKEMDTLKQFCAEHHIDGEIGWWLSSLWG